MSQFSSSRTYLLFFKVNGLVPFNVRQQQVAGTTGSHKVAYIKFVTISYSNVTINLYKNSPNWNFTVNGIARTAPYIGWDGSTVNIIGGKLVLSAYFGLTVAWDGSNRATYTISQNYSAHVCGLCGNADGLSKTSWIELIIAHCSPHLQFLFEVSWKHIPKCICSSRKANMNHHFLLNKLVNAKSVMLLFQINLKESRTTLSTGWIKQCLRRFSRYQAVAFLRIISAISLLGQTIG